MSRDSSTPGISWPSAGPDRLTTTDRTADPAAERAQLAELAAQFESTLMLEMMKQMRQSLLDEGAQGEGLGNDTYTSTIDSELALHLSRAGGMGLTSMLVDAWDRRQGATPAPTGPAPAGPAGAPAMAAPVAPGIARASVTSVAPATLSENRPMAVTPARAAAASGVDLSLEMGAKVSSGYGWRSDPFRGHAKFHGGIDLAATYGTAVPAAATGTVVKASEQGAYGLTVVIRHANGFESRYAHLSSLDVKEGDTVAQGQQVGRVGSTGRSTGPHLHFEVTQAGRRVDPERFVRNLTSDIKGQ
jgi:peptidoglycan hydrolase FlgJ